MILAYKLLRNILKMDLGESNCYKIDDTKILYVENWYDEQGDWFTTLELVDGEEVNDNYKLNEILEIVTLKYKDKKEIKEGIKLVLRCYRYKYK